MMSMSAAMAQPPGTAPYTLAQTFQPLLNIAVSLQLSALHGISPQIAASPAPAAAVATAAAAAAAGATAPVEAGPAGAAAAPPPPPLALSLPETSARPAPPASRRTPAARERGSPASRPAAAEAAPPPRLAHTPATDRPQRSRKRSAKFSDEYVELED
jgi:hypothetical protein